ncbi:hypothetical protein, partial [Cardiobacterium hominis]
MVGGFRRFWFKGMAGGIYIHLSAHGVCKCTGRVSASSRPQAATQQKHSIPPQFGDGVDEGFHILK